MKNVAIESNDKKPKLKGRGGPGRGGGRKKGIANKRTIALREITDKAIAEGAAPLEVMLKNMRFYDIEADKAFQQFLVSQGTMSDDEFATSLKNLAMLRDKAQMCAVDAAPYVHPKLAAIALRSETFEKVEVTMTLSNSKSEDEDRSYRDASITPFKPKSAAG